MRIEDFCRRFTPLQHASAHACAVVFLHELSAAHTGGIPPTAARWETILDRPTHEWGAALDDAGEACRARWPKQLAGFFDDVRFAQARERTVSEIVAGMEKLAASARGFAGPEDRHTLLGNVYQETRSTNASRARAPSSRPGASRT
jgi:hypothetical protein